MEPTRRQYALALLSGAGLALLALLATQTLLPKEETVMTDFIFEAIGALFPIAVIGLIVLIGYLFDAALAAYRGRTRIPTGVSEAARTCDYCFEVKDHALLPADRWHRTWACFDCHEFWHPINTAIEQGFDDSERHA